MLSVKKSFKILIFATLFILAGSLFLHSFISINLDIGRHIKLGEVIWQTKEVPKVNLFSFTEPDYPFINHHWLSEMVFYFLDRLGGLELIVIVKAIILLASFAFLVFAVKDKNPWAVAISFLVSLALFRGRTEARPEIFSYLILTMFFFIIYRLRQSVCTSGADFIGRYGLWLLPILQLFWVNFHIYFFLGPVIFAFFFVERFFGQRSVKKELMVGALLGLATLVNPNGLTGALYPFHILKEYGYGVIENEPILNLTRYTGEQTFILKLFIVSFLTATMGIVLRIRSFREKIFEGLLLVFLAFMSFKIQRNLSLFALGLLPILAANPLFSETWGGLIRRRIGRLASILGYTAKFVLAGVIIFLIYAVVSNNFYRFLDSSRRFGWGYSSAADRAVEFVKDNHMKGPGFNNFEIGSFLIWKLYPEQKVFVDGRPEAYSTEFFNQVYKPMLDNQDQWEKLSETYRINYIFFNHNSLSDSAQKFILRVNKDVRWQLIFLNEAVVIYIKKNRVNQPLIDKYKINTANAYSRLEPVLARFDAKDDLESRPLASILLFLNMPEASAQVYEKLKNHSPRNRYAYQGAGLAYATIQDLTVQKKAAQNLEEAIKLGLDNANNYFTLGLVYANLGQNEKARQALEKVLDIDSNNTQARDILKLI